MVSRINRWCVSPVSVRSGTRAVPIRVGCLEGCTIDATHSKGARPGGTGDEQSRVSDEASLRPPVSDVNFIGDGGAELVFDENALNGIGGFEVVDEGLSKGR